MKNKTVIIMRGLPGSGKTAYIKKHFPNATVCSSDHYFTDEDGKYKFDMDEIRNAHGECKIRFDIATDKGDPLVIIDNTNTRWWEMEYYVEGAEEQGYELKFIRLEVAVDIAFKRNIHNTPKDIIEKFAEVFEELPEEYADQEIVIVEEQKGR